MGDACAFSAPIWHVDLSIGGHDHEYERTYPLDIGSDVKNPINTTADKGRVFLACAGSGAGGYAAGTSHFTAISEDHRRPHTHARGARAAR